MSTANESEALGDPPGRELAPAVVESDPDWGSEAFWASVEAPVGSATLRRSGFGHVVSRAAAYPSNEPILIRAAAVTALTDRLGDQPPPDPHELIAMARQLRAAGESARAARHRRRRQAWVSDNLADWCSFAVLVGLALFARSWWHQAWTFAIWAWVVMVLYASLVGLFSGFLRWHPVARDLLAPLTSRLQRRRSSSCQAPRARTSLSASRSSWFSRRA